MGLIAFIGLWAQLVIMIKMYAIVRVYLQGLSKSCALSIKIFWIKRIPNVTFMWFRLPQWTRDFRFFTMNEWFLMKSNQHTYMLTIYQFFFYLDWNTYVFNIKLEDFFHECRQTCQQSIVSPVVAHVRSQTGPYSRRHCNGFPRCLQCLIWRKCSQATSLQMLFENYLVFFFV